ncbi:MAG: Polysaccharide pyruvyl transferase [Clostridiales bacterium 38_11]|nr:MAG: Polysaccharide pyruvyl transferase [Clostridiales bacterium 38_11]HBH12732.1 polysaccharide pyruvyl transferase CsaB [Clostridiales bacterium]
MNKRAFIIGYYGSNNLGDELLLSETIKILQPYIKIENIKVLSYNVELTCKIHGISGVSRNKYINILKTIIDSDFIIGGGGSMLQNVTSNRSLIYYLVLINLAFLFKKKVILLGNGIGPINGAIQKRLVKKTLKKISYLHLRDIASYEWINGSDSDKIDLGVDLALHETEINKRPKTDCVIVNLRNWENIDALKTTIKDLVNYIEDSGYEVILLSMQKGNDDHVLQSLGKVDTFDDLEALKQKISSARYIIGMRLHVLILSAAFSIPFIGLAYDPKVSSFCKEMNQPYFDCFGDLNSEVVIETFKMMEKSENQSIETIKNQFDKFKIRNLEMSEKIGKIIRGQDEKN